MYNAYISYSSEDGDFAEKIASDLENRGLEVWFSKWEIRVGDSIIDKIFNEGLRKNDFFIVILSPHSISSNWVTKEINISLVKELNEKKISVLPVLFKKCIIPPALSDKKVADFVTDYQQGLKDLLLAISPEVYKEKVKRQTGNVVGIDFGTSNSLAAIIENGKPIIIPNREGNNLTPSVAAFTADGKWIAGIAAQLQAETNLQNTFFSIKSTFGTEFVATINGISYKNYDIASKIFRKLKDDCELYLWKKVEKVVLTCPVYFKQFQQHDLVKSAELAGLEVIRLISEPNAVIFSYGLHRGQDKVVAVYDFGGGSFDVSICECGDDICEVKSVSGDTRLGGDDIDNCVLSYCLEIFEKETGISLSENPGAVRRVLKEVESAKVILTSSSFARIYVPFICLSSTREPIHFDITITIDIFENLVSDLIDRSIHCCEKALNDHYYPPYLLGTIDSNKLNEYKKTHERHPWSDKVSKVILSGLSTKIPLIRKKVRDFFEIIPECKVNPDEVVALGASVQAGVLEGIEKSLMLDAISFSIGIEINDGKFLPIIVRNSTIPAMDFRICHMGNCYEKNVIIHVYEGENEFCAENNYLGTLSFRPKSSHYNNVDILVKMEIDANGSIRLLVNEIAASDEEPVEVYSKDFFLIPVLKRPEEKSNIVESNIEESEYRRKRKLKRWQNTVT